MRGLITGMIEFLQRRNKMKDIIWFIRDAYSYRRAEEGVIKTTINLPSSFIAFMMWRREIK